MYPRKRTQTPLGNLNPAILDEALARLATVIERQVARLQRIRAERVRIAEADAALAPARLAFQAGAEADRQRRYVLSRDRHVNRTIDEFLKVRTKGNDGAIDQVDLSPQHEINPEDSLNLHDEYAAVPGDSGAAIGRLDLWDGSESSSCAAEAEGTAQGFVDEKPCGGLTSEGEPFHAAQAEVVEQSHARSHFEEVTCDDAQFLRNEANPDRGEVRAEPMEDRPRPAAVLRETEKSPSARKQHRKTEPVRQAYSISSGAAIPRWFGLLPTSRLSVEAAWAIMNVERAPTKVEAEEITRLCRRCRQ
jgi:hypothetical protein